jgi:hypothetical protein
MAKNTVAAMEGLIKDVISDEANSLIEANPDASAEKIKDMIQDLQYDLLDGVYPIYWKDIFALIWDASDSGMFQDMLGWDFHLGPPETFGDAFLAMSNEIVDHLWGEVLKDFEPEMPEEAPEEE